MATTFHYGADSIFAPIYRRQCVSCSDNPLVCPSCPTGQVCTQTTLTCTECPARQCVPDGQSGATNNVASSTSNSGPNIGAIVGGIIGGLIFIAVAIWLVWRFVIQKRRQQWEQSYEPYVDKDGANGENYARSVAPSARTRASMASTTYTRASNVIQIAFIPGVTGRSDAYTPPVPPIPSSQPNSPYTDASGDHYFMPGDLRDSTYSGFTDDGASTMDRRSVARSIAPSIAPSLLRQSVASAIYREDAIQNPMPAQTAQRGRANMVSVKASANTSRSPSMRPTADNDGARVMRPSIASTPQSAVSIASTSPALRSSAAIPGIRVTSDTASEVSILTAAPEVRSAIEEATRRASRQPVHGGLGSVRTRDPSPFSDANRVSDGDETPVQ